VHRLWLRLGFVNYFHYVVLFDPIGHELVSAILKPMRRFFLSLCFLTTIWLTRSVSAQIETSPVVITAPQSGQVLQGSVDITGTSDVPGFQSAEIAFAFASDTSSNWFLIQSSEEPVKNGMLGTWDTTTLTDGIYTLRLRVNLQDGKQIETTVSGLRVRNYTPVETPTLTATPANQPTPQVPTMTSTPYPTPTPLPQNPAALTPINVYTSLRLGALCIGGFFLIFIVLLRLRKK
jgi:hypothetical protein